jgi:hypothetical protein
MSRVWAKPDRRTHVLYQDGILLGQILAFADSIAATLVKGDRPDTTMLSGTVEEAKAFVENACDDQSAEQIS